MTDTSTERIELHARKVDGWSFADNDISHGELEAWMHDASTALRALAAERDALLKMNDNLRRLYSIPGEQVGCLGAVIDPGYIDNR